MKKISRENIKKIVDKSKENIKEISRFISMIIHIEPIFWPFFHLPKIERDLLPYI